jgi:hypothetical protein
MKRTEEEIRQAILEYLEENENEFIDLIEELDGWNGYLNDDRYYYMEELDDLLCGKSPLEILEMANDDFNTNDNYFRFTCYGLESADEKDYSGYLDDNFVDEVIDNANRLDIPCELQELLDELDDLENEEEDQEGD